MIFITFNALAGPAEMVGERQPYPEVRRLWSSLFTHYHGRMLIIADGISDEGMNGREVLMAWLKKEGFKAASVDMSSESGSEVVYDRVMSLSSVFGIPHFFIDNDPETVAKVMRYGIPTLLVSVPHTIRPEWSEGRELKAWEQLVSEIDKQILAKQERTWGDVG